MQKRMITATLVALVVTLVAGCLPTQTIIVKFEDLKSDFLTIEMGLQSGRWAKFDWNTMTITISSGTEQPTAKPVALGSFPLPDDDRTALGSDADVDFKTLQMTDTVKQVIRQRQARYEEIMTIKRQGSVGEGNRGYLARPVGSNGPALDAKQTEVVNAENDDRLIFFKEVLRQRGMSEDKIEMVGQKFAEVQRAVAARGFWIQYEDGSWHQVE